LVGDRAVGRESDHVTARPLGELARDAQRLARDFLDLSVVSFEKNEHAGHQSAFASSRMYLTISFAAAAASAPSILRPPLFSGGSSSATTVTRWLTTSDSCRPRSATDLDSMATFLAAMIPF